MLAFPSGEPAANRLGSCWSDLLQEASMLAFPSGGPAANRLGSCWSDLLQVASGACYPCGRACPAFRVRLRRLLPAPDGARSVTWARYLVTENHRILKNKTPVAKGATGVFFF